MASTSFTRIGYPLSLLVPQTASDDDDEENEQVDELDFVGLVQVDGDGGGGGSNGGEEAALVA